MEQLDNEDEITNQKYKASYVELKQPNADDMSDSKQQQRTRRKIYGLTICLLVTACVAIVLLGVVIWSVNSKKGLVQPPSEGYVRASAAIGANMDHDADPCHDFAQYACGGWMKKHVIPDDMSKWSNFVILRDETAITLLNLINGLQESTDTKAEYLTKMLNLYSSCMDTSEMDKPATADKLSDQVKGVRDADTKETALATVAQFGISVFYRLHVQPDNLDPGTTSFYMVQGALGMTLKEEYNNTKQPDEIKEKQGFYQDYVRQLWKNYDDSLTDEQLGSIVDLVYNFESCVAEGMLKPDELRSAFAKMPSKPFSAVVQEGFATALLIDTAYKSRMTDGSTLTGSTKVYYHEDYITKVKTCVDTHLTKQADLANYVATRLMLQLASAAKESWRNLWWKNQQDVTKVQVKPARWKTCLNSITNHMPEAVGRIFAGEAFKEDAKKNTLTMIDDVKTAFKQILPDLEWMDVETRKAAIEKADHVGNKIGYPDWIMIDNELNKYLELFTISATDLLANTLSADKVLTRKTFDVAGGDVDKDKWSMSPATVNAYYSPKRNEMVFPAAILQPPFYHVSYPTYVNYGAIGVVIGHELTHGFDDSGRQYNKDGYLKDWYTEEAKEGFKKRADCMVNQYGGYSIEGSQVNGKLTLGENIADNGGVKQSYIAYQHWVKRNGEEPRLPGLDLTNEQAFFLSYAQIWCQKKTEEAFKVMIKTDPHSPGVFRIKGALVNSKEFAKAFNCKAEDPMNPSDKCEVW